MSVIARADAPPRRDPWITHFLRWLVAIVLLSVLFLLPMPVGFLIWFPFWVFFLPWVGYRHRDALFLLLPIWNVVLVVKATWRLTALNVDWPERPDVLSRSIFREWPSRVGAEVHRPGYWRVISSVDEMDEHSDFLVPLPPTDALDAAWRAVQDPRRVLCEFEDGELRVHTTQHTPAYGWIGFVPLLFARRDEYATVTVENAPEGALLVARGRLDTGAARRLRALRAPA